MKKIITILFVLVNFGLMVFAQEKTAKEKKGDKFYFVYDFERAIDKYESTALTEDGQRKYAESLHKMYQNEESEKQYATLVNISNGKTPEDFYNYAEVLKSNGKYNEYMTWMDKFASLKPNDLRVKSYEFNKVTLNTLLIDQKKQSISHLDINTKDQDFGTAYMNDQVVFASSRAKPRMIKRTDNQTSLPYLNLYQSTVDGNQLGKPTKFDKDLNSKRHDGPASFCKKGSYMAFTRNNVKDKSDDKIVELQIHFSALENNEWSKPIPFQYNNEGYSVGHPCLSEDGKTMYFTSDMPGGFGGSDLYKTTSNEQGTWSKPTNLGDEINTEGDEMFPFYDEKSQVLYFSSDGHFGLGGLDIFYFANNEVVNFGNPINTRQDDFSFIVNSATQKGYLSSNRPEGNGSDDIYGVSIIENIKKDIKIEGFAKNIENIGLDEVFVNLYNEDGSLLHSVNTEAIGYFSFKAPANKNYTITGNKTGYSEGTNKVSTITSDSIVRCDVILTKNAVVEVEEPIEINSDLGKINNLNNIYFDYDMFNIRPDAAIELDKIVKTMNKYPTLEVELKSYTDCRGPDTYNQYLSDRRATSSAEYIQARITNPTRIKGKGYGETKSLNDCKCEEGVISECPKEEHQQNRRTEFIVLKK